MEMLTNTIKHARASQIDVVIEHAEDYFELNYRDNGIGFDSNKPKVGMGMNNMIDRAHFLGAEFKMEGKLDEGVSAKLKLKKD